MEIKRFNNDYTEKVLQLLSNNIPYVFPHHPYVYWIMGEYFPSLTYVAIEDDIVVGYICALHSIEKGNIFIWQLVVDGTFRRVGTAKLLCGKIIYYMRENEIKTLQITISDKNITSKAFFTALAEDNSTILNKIKLVGLDSFNDESAYELRL